MHETDTPTNVGSNDGLGLVQDRAAFDRLVLQLTGRGMDYHNRNGTTGLDTAWLCYRDGVAAERERGERIRILAEQCARWHIGDGDECGTIARELLALLIA